MPELCRFYGITIRIYMNDHGPPHFHALYGDEEALIGIDSLAVLRGSLPTRARRMALEWALLRQMELREAWDRARRSQPVGKIAPLE